MEANHENDKSAASATQTKMEATHENGKSAASSAIGSHREEGESLRKRHKHKSKRKEKKHKKHRKHKHRSSSASSSSSSSSWSSSSSSSRDSSRRQRKHKHHKKEKRRKREEPSSSTMAAGHDSTSDIPLPNRASDGPHPPANIPNILDDGADDDTYGPIAPLTHTRAHLAIQDRGGYGQHLLAGEGEAIAEFVKNNERIPRRGEVGYDGEQIKKLEELGYVMSGSRHKRMEAVRKRKENQIISAEEKRLLIINERQKKMEKEAKVLEEVRHLIKKKEYETAASASGGGNS